MINQIATLFRAGLMGAGDKAKLDAIPAGVDATNAATVGTAIFGSAAKATPVDADTVPLTDSAAANGLKKLTWANLKAALKAYFDTLYAAVAHTHAFADLTARPTTLGGYGIADGLQSAAIGDTVQPFDADTAKLDVDQAWSGAQRSTSTALSIASGAIAWTLASGNDFTLALSANAVLSLPTDIASFVGQTGTITITQAGAGGFTFGVASGIVPANDSVLPAALPTTGAVTLGTYKVLSGTTILLSLIGAGGAL